MLDFFIKPPRVQDQTTEHRLNPENESTNDLKLKFSENLITQNDNLNTKHASCVLHSRRNHIIFIIKDLILVALP